MNQHRYLGPLVRWDDIISSTLATPSNSFFMRCSQDKESNPSRNLQCFYVFAVQLSMVWSWSCIDATGCSFPDLICSSSCDCSGMASASPQPEQLPHSCQRTCMDLYRLGLGQARWILTQDSAVNLKLYGSTNALSSDIPGQTQDTNFNLYCIICVRRWCSLFNKSNLTEIAQLYCAESSYTILVVMRFHKLLFKLVPSTSRSKILVVLLVIRGQAL